MSGKIIQMRSSSLSKQKEQPDQPDIIEQFASAMYLDEAGEIKFVYHVVGNFPKDRIIPTLIEMAEHVKTHLLDHIMPGQSEEAMAEMRNLASEGDGTGETTNESDKDE